MTKTRIRCTWTDPHITVRGRLSAARKKSLPPSAFAFRRLRKSPLCSASHVRAALARFRQVIGATDAERDTAFRNIQLAAKRYGVTLKAQTWRDLGKVRKARKTG